MRMRLIVNVGIIAMIVAGCATPPPIQQTTAPRALASLSCGAGQRIVIAALPVESPDVAGIFKREWGYSFSGFGLVNQLADLIPRSTVDDLTPEFKKAIGAVLGPIDLQQLLLARAEQVIKPRTSCKTAFLPTTLGVPAAFLPSDKVVVIRFYSMFTGGPPVVMGYLSATVMTGENAADAKRANEVGKIWEEMKNLEPYVKATDKPPDFGKIEQYTALAQKLQAVTTPYSDAVGMVDYTSPGHSTDEWLANGGAVTTQEMAAVMDRLIGDVVGILFK